jgi:hypothetical protein
VPQPLNKTLDGNAMKSLWFAIKFLVSLFLAALAIFSLLQGISENKSLATYLTVSLIFSFMAALPWLVKLVDIKSSENNIVKAAGRGIERVSIFIIVMSIIGVMAAFGMSPDDMAYFGKLVFGAILTFGSIIIFALYQFKSHRRNIKKAQSSAQLHKKRADIFNLTKDNALDNYLQETIKLAEDIRPQTKDLTYQLLLVFTISLGTGIALIGNALNFY